MHLEMTGINIHHLIDTNVHEHGNDIQYTSDVTEPKYPDVRLYSP